MAAMPANPDDVPEIRDEPSECNGTLRLLTSQFERLYAMVLTYLVHRLFDHELAEELTAETFYRAARSVRRLSADEKQIRLWLLRTATNLANTHYRKTRLHRRLLHRFSRTLSETTEPDAPHETVKRRRMARIRQVVQALPVKNQTVVTLRYYMRMSFDDMAVVLGCRPDAAQKRLSRAVDDLRRRVRNDGTMDT